MDRLNIPEASTGELMPEVAQPFPNYAGEQASADIKALSNLLMGIGVGVAGTGLILEAVPVEPVSNLAIATGVGVLAIGGFIHAAFRR